METTRSLELRMYFFTNYQLMGIQKGIQCGHAALEYAFIYGQEEDYQNFIKNWKTWIILNGGTTNNRYDSDDKPLGSMNEIINQLQGKAIQYSHFQEPDLNDALTAICFLCDERVWNKKDYPDFPDYFINKTDMVNPIDLIRLRLEVQEDYEKFKSTYHGHYERWIEFMGGIKNVFLRELIKGKKLA